ncbi:Abi-like protein [Peptoanaerobacter stomatis]|uniref:Abi-like protein n=1 Tax=Peptoanaerobacter stomatis TaxID=796937 RepID=J5UM01_9FIRM|nr:Abi family protein [Peptoanaerobacter stomatis]EJU23564.1 Abi-like protein [Peptoanaerobacter stomatis]NWO24337.1 Abi family protein [Peptostreptococcaceae bacterium oral taxon 081]
MKKVFSNVGEQINILKSKNLTIKDEQKAVEMLVRSNYYVVINGYRTPFLLDRKSGDKSKYIPGSAFEEIYSLYMFDRSIRIIFLKYILIMEQNLKSAISYEFSKIYGSENYLHYSNFACEDEKNTKEIFFLIGSLHNALSKAIGKNEYITYNIEKYNNVPFWILANILTFGGIINFYKLMKDEEKQYIARKYFRVKVHELETYMELLNAYRNICAHDERLYNVKATKFSIAHNEYHTYFEINDTSENGKKDVFALCITLCMLLSREDKMKMINELIAVFEDLDENIDSIHITKIYNMMGFPHNWKEIKDINF